jgi:uncharacterized iron-regulated protein
MATTTVGQGGLGASQAAGLRIELIWHRLARIVSMAILALGLAATGAGAAPCARPGGPSFRDEFWRTNEPAHPLMGQVLKGEVPIAIAPGDCERSPLQQLIAEVWQVIREGGVVLLGEVHDNPQQHLVREDMLWPRWDSGAQTDGLRPAAVFEHIRADQKPLLDRFYEQAASSRRLWTASDLLKELDWKDSGWPAAEIFEPLYGGALWAKMPVLAGDPTRERIRALARGDRTSLTEAELALIKVGEDVPQPLLDALNQELVESHCGLMPASAFGNMNMAQRFRDAYQARALVDAAEANGSAFLLAGNGHLRTDRAVPWYVRRMAPGRKVVSVMLLEVTAGENDAASYLPRDPDGKAATDYVLFTPRTERPDPCQKMREQFSKKK